MKGIILAGGKGTRLRPMTAVVNKHLLPVYDKPMIFYPLATLMQAGIRDILIITAPEDKAIFESLLGDGKALGITLSYAVQPQPEGIAQALIIGKEFINNEPSALILGDNIFLGTGMQALLDKAMQSKSGGTVLAIEVADPQRFGVVEFDSAGKPAHLIEKPSSPKSKWAVAGLYFYDGGVAKIAETLKPSARGELEITDINQAYLDKNTLTVLRMDETTAWLDTGTPDSLLQAANYVQIAEARPNGKIACLEEIAFKKGFISADQMLAASAAYKKTAYGDYLLQCAKALESGGGRPTHLRAV